MSRLADLVVLALSPTPREVRDACRAAAGEKYDEITGRYRRSITELVEKTGKPRAEAWALVKMKLARDGDDVVLALAMAAEFDEQESLATPPP